MSDPVTAETAESITSFDLLRDRLAAVSDRLAATATSLNEQRTSVFAPQAMTLAEQDRIHTDSACLPRDAVSIGDLMLLGYNIPPGLTSERTLHEVFALFRVVRKSELDWDVVAVPTDDASWFLSSEAFQRDFGEIYKYYADARLVSLGVVGDELRMTFGIGSAENDVRTLRWRMPRPASPDLPIYVDAYGEEEGHANATFDFNWTPIGRDALSGGRWPHLNVLNTIFIGAHKGALDFRIDDPLMALSEGGRSIATDRVSEAEADVAEHRVAAAKIGDLLLLRILPYREDIERYYAYSRLSRRLERIDAIGRGCRMLPEDQGIVFPGGYLLASGETRVFATDAGTARLIASHRSPNGEDVLYVYRRPDTGGEILCAYNLVRREMAVPVAAIGYALFPDGTIICVRDSGEPQRVHTVAIYNSPFCLPERYDPEVASDSMFGRIGNTELVSGLSEAISLANEAGRSGAAGGKSINRSVYEALINRATKLLDRHAWMSDEDARGINADLVDLRKSAGDVLDELASVTAGQREAADQVELARTEVADYLAATQLSMRDADAFIDALSRCRTTLNKLAALSEVRYVETAEVDELRVRVEASYEELGANAVDFLGKPNAFDTLRKTLEQAGRQGRTAPTAAGIDEQSAAIDAVGQRIALLTEVVGALDVADVTQRTSVLGSLAELLANRNGIRAELEARRSSLRAGENEAAFAASIAVVGQRLQSSMLLATDPAACDGAVTELLAEVENIALSYGDVDAFSDALDVKRAEIIDSFARKRDELTKLRAGRIDRLVQSTQRTIATLGERAASQTDRAAVDTLFTTDPLAARIKSAVAELRTLGEEGRAEELGVALTAARDAARRSVSDRSELFADGTVQLGTHRVGINKERFALRLTTDGSNEPQPVVRLTGTDLEMRLSPSPSASLIAQHPEWIDQTYGSETPTIGRALALALSALDGGLDPQAVGGREALVQALRVHAAAHPDLGSEAGVHDEDAARFIEAIAPIVTGPQSLQAVGIVRGAAVLLQHSCSPEERSELDRQLSTIAALGARGGRTVAAVVERWAHKLTDVFDALDVPEADRPNHASSLVSVLADRSGVVISAGAGEAAQQLRTWAAAAGLSLPALPLAELHACVLDQLHASVGESLQQPEGKARLADLAAEVCALIIQPSTVVSSLSTIVQVLELRSRGQGITDGRAELDVPRRLTEWRDHQQHGAARFAEFDAARKSVLAGMRDALSVDLLRPRVITGFVRNRLVDEVLLPIVGNAVAKQLGLAGPSQGLLLLISPPGYGKTTLLEYVADLLGFAMVKINGPAIGSSVTSLDPAAAPDRAAAAELVKLNRSFAMGTNTVCLVDDIQHLHPELLQKFIPLSDATRRIEGVMDGEARTFDLRGKRFVVAMAGNPYTSTGASFRLPDMLANRSDVHNLGDLVGTPTMAAAFAQSYIENACGANETLRPLLAEGRHDIEILLAAAHSGSPVHSDQLRRSRSSTELGPMVKTLRHLVTVRDMLLRVNAAYIASAQLTDEMRGEPPFLLQGSYRNMTRIAQRIVPVMSDKEVVDVVADHYRSESQTLASAAAWNLAKWRTVVGVGAEALSSGTDELGVLRSRWQAERTADDPAASLVDALRSIESALRSTDG
jgi:hypothetical protein